MAPSNIHNLIGQQFGRLTILRDSGKRTTKCALIATCQCVCGNIKDIVLSTITRGDTTSCGCWHIERSSKTTKDDHKEIARLYIAGLSSVDIGTQFSLDPSTIRDILQKAGVPRREQDIASRLASGHTLNETVFDVLDDSGFYWVGFLITDGNSYNNTIQVALQAGDLAHLNKLKEFVGGSQTCTKYINKKNNGEYYHYGFGSKHIVDTLAVYGIVPRKSLIATPSHHVTNNRHFWRGVIDGNGHLGLCNKIYPSLGLCGSNAVITQFLDFIVSSGIKTKASVRPDRSIFATELVGSPAVATIRLLYEDSKDYLDRKYARALQLINLPPGPGRGRRPSIK